MDIQAYHTERKKPTQAKQTACIGIRAKIRLPETDNPTLVICPSFLGLALDHSNKGDKPYLTATMRHGTIF